MLLQCSLDVFVVPGWDLAVGDNYGGAGLLEMLIPYGCLSVQPDQCFQKEFDGIFANRIPCQMWKIMLVFVGLFAEGAECN